MSTQPPLDDSQNIWQDQSDEPPGMSLHEFHEKLRRLQSKSRRDNLTTLLRGVAALIFFVFISMRVESPLDRFAWELCALAGLAAVLPHAIALWNGARRENLAPDMAMTTGIEFYRRLLEPQRTYEKWTAVSLLLMFFAMMLILVPGISHQIENPGARVSIRPFLPFLTILVGCGFLFIVSRRRRQRWLRRELDQLAALEKENR